MRTIKQKMNNNGVFVTKTQCPNCASIGKDKSKNNLTIWRKPDKSLDGYCFACDTYYKEEDLPEMDDKAPNLPSNGLSSITQYPSIEIKDRRITQQTTAFYGVTEHTATDRRFYPCTRNNKLVGYKCRKLPKSFDPKDGATPVGDNGLGDFFGQHKFSAGGGIVVITEGEEDAMAAFEMMKYKSKVNKNYPCVSITRGIKSLGKQVKLNYEWLNSFDKVVFAVDQEDDAIECAREAAELLEPGKGHIATFQLKDASDMAKAGKYTDFWQSIWNAESIIPNGIVEGSQVWNAYKKKDFYHHTKFPEEWGLNDFNYGLYYPALFTITAGTGIGKSTILKHLQYHLYRETSENVGVISMEEPIHLCSGALMGLHMKKRIMLPDVEVTEKEERDSCRALFESGRFIFCDNVGIRTPDDLYNKIRFMARARQCKFIFLDHLTAIVNKFSGSGSKNDYTENVVNTLNDLCQELQICLILVSHVRKTGEGSESTYETGKVPTEDSIFGSSSIKQYSYCTLSVSRNKSLEDSPMFIHVLKDRLSGKTGKSVPLFFDSETGWLTRSISKEDVV